MPDERYHYPPDLLAALIEAIPLICRSKRDVLTFFRSAGVDYSDLSAYEIALARNPGAVKKHIVTRQLLVLINERSSNEWLRVRREVVKRVVEFENFEAAWPDKQTAARGAVAKVRELQNKKDSFARLQEEHERQRRVHMAERDEELARVKDAIAKRDAILGDFGKLFTMNDHYERARQFESVMNRLFAFEGISVREAFRVRLGDAGVVEQIDGVIALDGTLHLVEAKWWSSNLGTEDVSQHMVRVFTRGHVSGLFIVEPGYTAPAVTIVQQALSKATFVLATISELYQFFAAKHSIEAWLRRKVQAAQLDRNPLFLESPQIADTNVLNDGLS